MSNTNHQKRISELKKVHRQRLGYDAWYDEKNMIMFGIYELEIAQGKRKTNPLWEMIIQR